MENYNLQVFSLVEWRGNDYNHVSSPARRDATPGEMQIANYMQLEMRASNR